MTRRYLGVLMFRGFIAGLLIHAIRELTGAGHMPPASAVAITAIAVLASCEVSRWFFPESTP